MSASDSRAHRLRRAGISVAGIVGLAALVVAGATVWLVLTDPVTVAEAVDSGDYEPLIEELADVIYKALRGLLDYL